jgi:hypothetical protein
MSRRQHLLLTLIAPLALILVACGGAAAPGGNDPSGVVRNALSLVQAKDLTGLTNIACAAQRDEIVDSFTGGLAQSGMDPEEVMAALNIDTSKVTVGAVTENGDTASVALGGTMAFSFDEAKMRELIKAQLVNEGQPADDASVATAMGFLTAMLGQPIPMDGQTMELVREGGAWKICDDA